MGMENTASSSEFVTVKVTLNVLLRRDADPERLRSIVYAETADAGKDGWLTAIEEDDDLGFGLGIIESVEVHRAE